MNPDCGLIILNRHQSSEDNNSVAIRDLCSCGVSPEHTLAVQISPNATIAPQLLLTQHSNFQLRLTNALDTAYKLLEASKDVTDFTFRHQLVSRSIAIGDSVCGHIANPMSFYRPQSEEIQSAKELLLLCDSAMIQLLCADGYITHRESVHHYMFQLIRMYGYDGGRPTDPRIMVAFQTVKEAVESIDWSTIYRIREWQAISVQVPREPHFLGLLYWTYLSALKIELGKIDLGLPEGVTDDMKDAIPELQVIVDWLVLCMDAMASEGGEPEVDSFPRFWKSSDQYTTLGHGMLERFKRTRIEVETRWLLKKGDILLELATDRVRKIEFEYFEFQARLALDSYRSAYNVCTPGEDINVELEGMCLWSMGRVMGQYLDLHDHAHQLYLQAVKLAGAVSALLPNAEWYSDSVEKIQWYRKKVEDKENIQRRKKAEAAMGKLAIEMMQLHWRAEWVKDEQTLRAFFGWLLRTHPPPCTRTEVTREVLASRELSRVVLNIIAAYDASGNNKLDDSCEFLCEEIIKVLPAMKEAKKRLSIAFLGVQASSSLGYEGKVL
jgi:hypothetical protein